MIVSIKLLFPTSTLPASINCKFAEGVSPSPRLVPLSLWECMTAGPAGRLGEAAVKFREVMRTETVAKKD